MRYRPAPRALSLLAAVAAAAALVLAGGCSGKSPTEPSTTPAPPSAPPPGGSYTVTVTSSQAELAVGSADPAIITVQVRQSNGQAPPNGTTAVLVTTLGALGSAAGPASVGITLNGGLASVPLFAGTITGTAIVQAQISGSIGQTTVEIREPDAFFLAFVSPSVGSPAGGDVVTVNGSGFEAPVRVTFGGVNAQVQSSSSTQIRVVTPASAAGANQATSVVVAVTIRVNQPDEASDSLNGAFTYQPDAGPSTPQIFSVSPTTGPNEGGTQVIIVGDGFEAPVQVVFGTGTATTFQGVEATVQSVSQTRLVVVSPAAQGFGQDLRNTSVNLLVRNLNSGLTALATSAFRYGTQVLFTSIKPGSGDYRGGDLVTIFGQGFQAPVAVQFGGLPQEVVSVTGTEVVVRTVAARVTNCAVAESGFTANVGAVSLVNINNGDGATGLAFEYLIPRPLITFLNPNSGSESGFFFVTITGTGFEPPTRESFGGQSVFPSTESSTTILVRTPKFTGTFPERPCGVEGMEKVPVSVDVSVRNLSTGCTDTLPNGFTYNPNEAGCREPPAPPAP